MNMNDPIPTLTPESLIQTYQRAKDRRRMWESHWSEPYVEPPQQQPKPNQEAE